MERFFRGKIEKQYSAKVPTVPQCRDPVTKSLGQSHSEFISVRPTQKNSFENLPSELDLYSSVSKTCIFG
jgi:hypothetical protein